MSDKQLDEARRVAEQSPGDAREQLKWAMMAYDAGLVDESEDAYRRARDLSPEDPDVLEGQARFEILDGNFDAAGSSYRQLTKLGVKPNAERLLNQALWASAAGEYGQARDLLAAARSMEPENELPFVVESQLELQLGDIDRALVLTDEGINRFADSGVLREIRAQVRFLFQDFEGAETDSEQALKLDPTLVDARVVQSNLWLLRGEPEEAAQQLLDALELDPENAEVWIALSSVYQIQGDIESTAQSLQQAHQLDPENWLIYQMLANLDLVAGDKESGLEHTQMALDLGGGGPGLLALRGTFLAQSKRLDEAKECFERAIELNREDGLYWVSLAEVELARAEPGERAALDHVRDLVRSAMDCELTENATARAERLLAHMEKLLAAQ